MLMEFRNLDPKINGKFERGKTAWRGADDEEHWPVLMELECYSKVPNNAFHI